MSDAQLRTATGLEPPVLMRALRSLHEDGYITGALVPSGEEDYPIGADGVRLLPKGKRQARLWPSEDWAAAFLTALQTAIMDETDGERRSKMERAVDALKALGAVTLNAAIASAVGIGISRL